MEENSIDVSAIQRRTKECFEQGLYFEVIALLSDFLLKELNDSELYIFRCRSSFRISQIDEALFYINEAIFLDSKCALAFMLRGSIWQQKGEFEKAIEDCNVALQIDPKYSDALLTRAEALFRILEFDRALKDANEAIRLVPNEPVAFNNRGTYWGAKGEYKKAIEDFSKAIELDPQLSEAFSNRGRAWNEIKETRKAIADLTEAIRLDSNFAMAYNIRGIAWTEIEEFEKAVLDLSTAMQLDKSLEFSVHLNLGRAYRKKGDHQFAINHYKRAYFVNRNSPKLLEVFFNAYSAPFILRKILSQVVNKKNITAYYHQIIIGEENCGSWLLFMQYLKIIKGKKIEELDYLRLKAVVSFYMGDSISSYFIYKDKLKHEFLTFQDLYYFILSASDFLEPSEAILQLAIKKMKADGCLSEDEYYYLGQIYRANLKFEEAESCFKKAREFIPARLALLGVYKVQNNESEIEKLVRETSLSELKILESVPPVKLEINSKKKQFLDSFINRLFYYELQDEISYAREINDQDTYIEVVEFYNILQFDDEFKGFMEEKIELRQSKMLETELIRIFEDSANQDSVPEIMKMVQNNNDAKAIILRVEQNMDRFATGAEKELAISINELKEPAEWYILLIKYFFLSKKLSARSGVILHYYVLKISQLRKNRKIEEVVNSCHVDPGFLHVDPPPVIGNKSKSLMRV